MKRKTVLLLLRVWFWASVLLAATCFVLAAVGLARGAPAPLPRKPPREINVAGAWKMPWCGFYTYHVVLHENGLYDSHAGGCHWYGWWTLRHRGAGYVLHIAETTGGHAWNHFDLILDSALKGEVYRVAENGRLDLHGKVSLTRE